MNFHSFRWVLAIAIIPLGVLNAITAYRHLMQGEPILAAFGATAVLMVLWFWRFPAAELLTRFSFWWIQRQVENAHFVIKQVNMKTGKQENKQDETD